MALELVFNSSAFSGRTFPVITPAQKPETTAEMVCRMFAEIEDVAGWRRNAKGNLVRKYGSDLLTVFRQGNSWKWCWSVPGEAPTFSKRGYDSEEDAIAAVAEAVLSDFVGLIVS
jgi:hypothetical protein